MSFVQKTVSLRNEHEAQMRALRCEHEDECRKLQEELDLQKSKVYISRSANLIALPLPVHLILSFAYIILQEDRQRALLQLQWKVMSDKPKEDQEVNSKKVSFYDQ